MHRILSFNTYAVLLFYFDIFVFAFFKYAIIHNVHNIGKMADIPIEALRPDLSAIRPVIHGAAIAPTSPATAK